MEGDESREYNRKIVSFKDFGRFKLSEKKYDDNSLNIYTARLNDLREDTLRRAKLKWSKSRLYILKTFFFADHVYYLHYSTLHMS